MPTTTRSSGSSSSGGSTFGSTIIVKTGKEKDVVTAFMIIAAYLIWIIDTSPFGWLGKSYKGFVFDSTILTKINWIGIATSGIVSVFLVYDILMSLKRRESTSYIFEMMVLFFINGSTMAAYYYAAFTNPIYNFIALGIFAAIAVYLIHRHGLAAVHSSELVTYYIMVLTYSFFWTLWNWTSNIKAIIHVFFITYFMLFYLRKKEGVNANVLYMFTAFFLLADFFGYSYDLNYLVSGFKISFPIIVLLASFYCAFFTESKFAQINAFVWTGILLFFIFAPAPAYGADVGVDVQERQGSSTWDTFAAPFIKAWESLTNKATGQLDVATGGLYRSQVEKNQYAQLGVFFDKVRAAQPRFYTDEQVTIWSTIRSKTLSDPVFIDFTCYRWDAAGNRIEAQKNEENQEKKDIVIPNYKFTVFTLEDKDVECTFNKNKLKAATNTITLSTSYNFATSAYQKVYFIDKDRQRSMVRQNLDPFKEFGIKDTAPKTIFTNGPVDIAVGVTQYLMPVEEEAAVKPSLGIELKNREKITDKEGKPFGEWKGSIKKIKELVVLLPNGLELDTQTCQPVKFKEYSDVDCPLSCSYFVSQPCEETCEKLSDSGKKSKCKKDCEDATEKCEAECDYLFVDGEGTDREEYTGYQLDIEELNKKCTQDVKDTDRCRRFGCRIIPKPEILENSPITTKFIRVRARYDYLVESHHSVTVLQPPTPITQSTEEAIKGAITLTGSLELEQGVDIPISDLYGLIYFESGARHCCLESGKNKGDTCAPSDDTICKDDRIITSPGGSSIGIMQINKINAGLASTACAYLTKERQTIYDKECNIRTGLELIKKDYKTYKNSANKDAALAKYCPSTEAYYSKYNGYNGFDAVLRAYNGWSCKVDTFIKPKICTPSCSGKKNFDACMDNCVKGVINYVEKVHEKGREIQADPSKFPFIAEFDQMIPKSEQQ